MSVKIALQFRHLLKKCPLQRGAILSWLHCVNSWSNLILNHFPDSYPSNLYVKQSCSLYAPYICWRCVCVLYLWRIHDDDDARSSNHGNSYFSPAKDPVLITTVGYGLEIILNPIVETHEANTWLAFLCRSRYPLQVETFSVSKTLTLSQEHPFVWRKWMPLAAHSYHFKC